MKTRLQLYLWVIVAAAVNDDIRTKMLHEFALPIGAADLPGDVERLDSRYCLVLLPVSM